VIEWRPPVPFVRDQLDQLLHALLTRTL
jgi:hypothetical protein